MTRLLIALLLALGLAPAAFATCNGTDLGPRLTAAEQASLDARLDATPFAQGNHWIARRGTSRLHLVGTLHLSDPRLDAPFARLSQVVKDADLLLLEMTATEQAQLESKITDDPTMVLLDGTTLPELMPEDDWTLLAEAMRARGLPPFMGARMQPWYVSMLLAVPPCLQTQLAARSGLDARLEEAAALAGVPVRALEAFDTGISLFAQTTLETQLLMIRASLAPPDVNEDLFETLLAAYFAEDHARSQITLEVVSPRLTALTQAQSDMVFRAFDDLLLETRNKAWIPVLLDALDTSEGPVVAAFGAAHLGGTSGILQLLQDEGFTLERAPF